MGHSSLSTDKTFSRSPDLYASLWKWQEWGRLLHSSRRRELPIFEWLLKRINRKVYEAEWIQLFIRRRYAHPPENFFTSTNDILSVQRAMITRFSVILVPDWWTRLCVLFCSLNADVRCVLNSVRRVQYNDAVLLKCMCYCEKK